MTFRRADSKGRLTGFDPGVWYQISEDSTSIKVVTPSEDYRHYSLPAPLNDRALGYLEGFGVDASRVMVDGHNPLGYFRAVLDEEGRRTYDSSRRIITEWTTWPEGFDYLNLVELSC